MWYIWFSKKARWFNPADFGCDNKQSRKVPASLNNRSGWRSLHVKAIKTLGALAESNRLQIVELLRNGAMTVGEIAERLDMRQPQASKHLRVLLGAGIVEVRADANRRYYALRAEPFAELDDWLENYRQLWSERYDNLDLYLEKMKADYKKTNQTPL